MRHFFFAFYHVLGLFFGRQTDFFTLAFFFFFFLANTITHNLTKNII